jgi:hypothetical protein
VTQHLFRAWQGDTELQMICMPPLPRCSPCSNVTGVNKQQRARQCATADVCQEQRGVEVAEQLVAQPVGLPGCCSNSGPPAAGAVSTGCNSVSKLDKCQEPAPLHAHLAALHRYEICWSLCEVNCVQFKHTWVRADRLDSRRRAFGTYSDMYLLVTVKGTV